MKNYAAEIYRIAEEAHKGAADTYIRDLCHEASRLFDIPFYMVYRDSEHVYNREFA